jgi:hypothetical protein
VATSGVTHERLGGPAATGPPCGHPTGQAVPVADDVDGKRYASAMSEVRSILNRFDLEGLIARGAPLDEYDGEARELVKWVVGSEVPSADPFISHGRNVSRGNSPDFARPEAGDLPAL